VAHQYKFGYLVGRIGVNYSTKNYFIMKTIRLCILNAKKVTHKQTWVIIDYLPLGSES